MGTTAAATAEADVSINEKDLVTALAEQHRLSKRASQKMLDDLIVMITRHLKKGERVKSTGSASCKCPAHRYLMSALPPKADMCGATRDVRFGPKADITPSFDYFFLTSR